VAPKKARPVDLVDLAYRLTEGLPAPRAKAVREIVAHLAIVVGGVFQGQNDKLWTVFWRFAMVFGPRKPSELRCCAAVGISSA